MQALKKYIQALTLDPGDIESMLACGNICRALGKTDDARDFFEQALEVEPWSEDARQAIDQLDAEVPATPAPVPASDTDLYGKAQALAQNGNIQGAVEVLEQLVARDPGHALALNDLGVLRYESGNKEESLRCYERAVALAPDNTTFMKNLADFYFVEQGRTRDALQIYVKILETDNQDIDCFFMGVIA